jgi:hypothetical protein
MAAMRRVSVTAFGLSWVSTMVRRRRAKSIIVLCPGGLR